MMRMDMFVNAVTLPPVKKEPRRRIIRRLRSRQKLRRLVESFIFYVFYLWIPRPICLLFILRLLENEFPGSHLNYSFLICLKLWRIHIETIHCYFFNVSQGPFIAIYSLFIFKTFSGSIFKLSVLHPLENDL